MISNPVLIRTLGYLERVLDHVGLCALGIYGCIVPSRLSGLRDGEYELVLRVKFPKVFFN